MTLMHRIVSIVRWVLRRDRAEQQLDEELQAYIEMSAADKIRDGVPAAEARRLARLELGGVEQAKERVRTYRHGAWLDEIGRDLRYACRMLAKHPGFTTVVVLTLALGIGANTAIFSLIDALLLRPLPVRDPHELVQVQFGEPGSEAGDSVSYVIVRVLAEQDDIFDGVAGFTGDRFKIGAPGATARVRGALVTGQYYATLGLSPARGRLLMPSDDERGAPLVAVISDGYWDRQFARRDDAIGDTLLVNGVPVTIVGVSPPGFVGANVGTIADVTLAVAALDRIAPSAASLLGPGNFWLRVLARPRGELAMRDVAARLNSAWPQISAPAIPMHWPASRRQSLIDSVFTVSSGSTGWTYLRTRYAKPLLVLMAAVAVVLLIACANVASLLLARASARQREIALRLAIGAGRRRIMQQFLIESVLLSLAGATAGIALAWLGERMLIDLISTAGNQVIFDLTPNWRVLAFTSTVAILTGVLFGLAPALQATAATPSAALRDDGRMSASRSRMQPVLVGAQVALSLVLLVGAGLLVRTLQNLQRFDPGFDARGVLLADFEERDDPLPLSLPREIEGLPGVLSASLSTHTPLSGSFWSEAAVPAGQQVPERDTAIFVGAGPRFFETLGIDLLEGREFTAQDSVGSQPVAIVNEQFAQHYFPNQHVIGQRLSAVVRGDRRELEIIGLANNTNAEGLREAAPRTVYVAYAQLTGNNLPTTLEVRSASPLPEMTAAIGHALQRQMPGTSVDIRPLAQQVENTMSRERLMATLATTFGALALALACVGLYGLLAYSVAQRTKEIGIRMALGAQRTPVIALVLARAARLVTAGIVFGLPAAWMASRWVESMLFGVTRTDSAAVAGSIALLAAAAVVAAFLPAWRAARVDPLTALRHE